MPLRNRLSLCSLAIVFVLAASAATRAYTTLGKWGVLPVLFFINPQNADVSSDAAEAAVLAAMDVWNTQGGTPFRFSYAGRTSTSSLALDGKNIVVFRNQNNGSVAATTYSWMSGGKLIDSDIVYWDGGFRFYTGTSGCSGGLYIEDIGVHELGHALGLDHSSDLESSMYPTANYCSTAWRTLAPDDIAGIQSLYGTSSTNQPPSVSITNPAGGATVLVSTPIGVGASASDVDGAVTEVRFFANGAAIGTDATAPYGVTWSTDTPGTYALTATAVDNGGATRTSAAVTIQVTAPSGSTTATFVTRDTTTQGNWQGTYGRDGYALAGDGVSLPAGVTMALGNQLEWVWATGALDARALQRTLGAGRIAATWYGQTFTVEVGVGSAPRRVSLYALDWDSTQRSQQIDVLDAATGALLDSRTVTGFAGGEHWVWQVTGAVRFRVTRLGGVNAVVSAVFVDPVSGGPANQLPSVSMTSPADGATVPVSTVVGVGASASDVDGTVTEVRFFANGAAIGTDTTSPYGVSWSATTPGTYALTATAVDNGGATRTSTAVTIQVTASPGSTTATFVARDTTTQGNWQGTYGRDGYALAGDGVSLPAGVTMALGNQLEWVWATGTFDPRALQRTLGAGRIAATWYGQTFTVEVGVGSTPRRVSLYALDWDPAQRSQQIDVLDAATGALLDSRTVTGFAGGEHWVWQVTGTVRFRITRLGGVNAVVSAVFVDP
jgi:hypothetical protein